MLKVMAFLVKRPGISSEELADYYENRHVPLILSLAPPPARYTRNYIQRDVTAEPRDDVDVVTELEFADAAAYRAWVAVMYAPGSGVADDKPSSSTGPRRASTPLSSAPLRGPEGRVRDVVSSMPRGSRTWSKAMTTWLLTLSPGTCSC